MAVAPAEPKSTDATLRVGVVGARRTRQGVGEHLARFFVVGAGARVVAVAGSTAQTAAEAAEGLRDRHGILAKPYGSAAEMVEREGLDVLVVASPPETHLGMLEIALGAGLHVLCEKPLVWHAGDVGADAARLVEAFAAKERCLAVNEQWPFALGAYAALFPDVDPAASRSFQMLLCPGSPDPAVMLVDAMPHPLSVLHHLHPGVTAPLGDVRVTPARSKGLTIHSRRIDVEFLFPTADGGEPVQCWVRLVPWVEQPRPAAFAFDGFMARRVLREPGYRMGLRTEIGGGREVDLPDPMEALLRAFAARVRAGPPCPGNPALAAASVHLRSICEAGSVHASGVAGPGPHG